MFRCIYSFLCDFILTYRCAVNNSSAKSKGNRAEHDVDVFQIWKLIPDNRDEGTCKSDGASYAEDVQHQEEENGE